MGRMAARLEITTSRIRANLNRTFMNGRMGAENIRDENIRQFRRKVADMGWADLVESTIDAICVNLADRQIQIEITCVWEGGGRKRIIASGVDDFVVNEMRLSNIIDRVTKFDAHDFKEKESEAASRLYFLMRGKEPAKTDFEWPPFKEKLAFAREGVLSLLEIEPVYGATVLVLAVDFQIIGIIE